MRIGHGFDIHPLVAGRRLLLGGIEVASAVGALGHSDADVVLHSLADAILGALGLGDIGERFPDTDPRYKDADSSLLLGEVLAEARKAGAAVVNADVAIYLERPKLGPLKAHMRASLARILGVEESRVGLKARTLEGLGPVGEGKAVAATAVVLLDFAARPGQKREGARPA